MFENGAFQFLAPKMFIKSRPSSSDTRSLTEMGRTNRRERGRVEVEAAGDFTAIRHGERSHLARV